MSVLILATIAISGGLAAVVTVGRPRISLAVSGLTAVLAVIVSASIGAQDGVLIAGTIVAGSDGLRAVALAWAAGILLIGLADALVGDGGAFLGPSLIGLGAGVVALAVDDAGPGFALLTAGALGTAVGTLGTAGRVPDAEEDAAGLGLRILRPLAGAGLLGLAVVAWGASAVGPFTALDPLSGVDPGLEVAVGLALVTVAAAVAIRMGATPAHIWAARFAESAPVAAIPGTLGWGAAAFGLVALGWVDVSVAPAGSPLAIERGLIAAIAAASVILGGLAAVLHDDIHHVLGYSIVQDAGVALLAFAVANPEGSAAGRDWLIGMAAVKTGLAAWVLAAHATFGARRLPDLRGWARSSPILGIGFTIALIGAVGLPGMATFAARGVLTDLALGSPLAALVLVAAFSPVIYLGRILVLGLDRMSEVVLSAEEARPRLRGIRPGGWTGVALLRAARAAPDAIRANRFVIAAGSALLVAAIGLGIAAAGTGPAGSGASSATGLTAAQPAAWQADQSSGATTQRSISRR